MAFFSPFGPFHFKGEEEGGKKSRRFKGTVTYLHTLEQKPENILITVNGRTGPLGFGGGCVSIRDEEKLGWDTYTGGW